MQRPTPGAVRNLMPTGRAGGRVVCAARPVHHRARLHRERGCLDQVPRCLYREHHLQLLRNPRGSLMAKKTLLDLTQAILNDMSGDEVNAIADTIESR